MDMFDKLQWVETKYLELREQMMDPVVLSDMDKTREIAKAMSSMQRIYDLFQEYKVLTYNRDEAKQIIDSETDQELLAMAQEQLSEASEGLELMDDKIKVALLPQDPNDDKNIFLEIRPAAGGDEAWLFAWELLKAYMLYGQKQGWKIEVIEDEVSDIGWVKLAIIKVSWDSVYSKLKWESWVHRVQRIPRTETQWRVHTSTITVAIMPEVADVDFVFNEEEVEIDTFAASSAGWQNANKNQTWVRLRHQPTGIIVTIADSKSQKNNKIKAFQILKAKLYQAELDKVAAVDRENRSDQIWWWDRSEKIRTYNFPQDRVTDHRIKHSRSNLPWIMMWNMDDIIEVLYMENQARLLAASLDAK